MPYSLIKALELLSEAIYYKITNPPEGFANVSQWTKQKLCWKSVQEMDLDVPIDKGFIIDREQQKYDKRKDKKDKRIDNRIETQMFVVNTDNGTWERIFEYYKKHKSTSLLSPMQMDILRKKASGILTVPSEKQSEILYKLYEQAKAEGFDL